MKDLLLRSRVVVGASNMNISRRRLQQKACRTCSTIIFPHSTNQIIDLWRYRCRYRRHFIRELKQTRRRRKRKRHLKT